MVAEPVDAPSREELIALTQAQAAQIAALVARVAELERRLGMNSSNSGKPPSSDGSRVSSLREASGTKPGGQKGHEGETRRQSDDPDVIIDHFPSICSGCGGALTPGWRAITPLARAPTKRGGKTRGRPSRRTGHNLLLRVATYHVARYAYANANASFAATSPF